MENTSMSIVLVEIHRDQSTEKTKLCEIHFAKKIPENPVFLLMLVNFQSWNIFTYKFLLGKIKSTRIF